MQQHLFQHTRSETVFILDMVVMDEEVREYCSFSCPDLRGESLMFIGDPAAQSGDPAEPGTETQSSGRCIILQMNMIYQKFIYKVIWHVILSAGKFC